jgi:two-component sensor histidine kinase
MRKGERRLRPEELPLQRAFAGEAIVGDEYDFVYPDGSSRVVLISARPIFGVGGNQVGAVAVGLDITERKQAEEQRRLLTNELNHRVKNTLAIVQSIALHTLRSSDSVEQAGERLESRLLALSRAHDILNRESWTGADIVEVANVTLPIEMGKIRTEGPAVWLRPTTAVTISLILHELATNAAKHGAFRSPGGEAAFRWRIADDGEGRRLEAHWSESGGPLVSEPARIGFGTRLIKRLVTAEPGGAVSQDYARDGFQCRFGFLLQAGNRREGKPGAGGAGL